MTTAAAPARTFVVWKVLVQLPSPLSFQTEIVLVNDTSDTRYISNRLVMRQAFEATIEARMAISLQTWAKKINAVKDGKVEVLNDPILLQALRQCDAIGQSAPSVRIISCATAATALEGMGMHAVADFIRRLAFLPLLQRTVAAPPPPPAPAAVVAPERAATSECGACARARVHAACIELRDVRAKCAVVSRTDRCICAFTRLDRCQPH